MKHTESGRKKGHDFLFQIFLKRIDTGTETIRV
jgi:hypothetical protein